MGDSRLWLCQFSKIKDVVGFHTRIIRIGYVCESCSAVRREIDCGFDGDDVGSGNTRSRRPCESILYPNRRQLKSATVQHND
jgi:hypothetical protein